MSFLRAGHVRPESLESGRGADMSSLIGVFGGRIDFLCFALHQLTQCIPLDSTKLLKLK
jgi:hypothetical protein